MLNTKIHCTEKLANFLGVKNKVRILVINLTRGTNFSNLFDGQRNFPKHVEFYSKTKLEKLVHLVAFITRIYHDARPPERQKNGSYCDYCVLKDISFMSVDQILGHELRKNTRIRWLNKKQVTSTLNRSMSRLL